MMNKKEIINAVVEETKYKRKEVADIYDALMQTFADAVSDGERVHLQGIGFLEVLVKQPRAYSDPRTQEMRKVGTRKKLHFVPSKVFNNWLNNKR